MKRLVAHELVLSFVPDVEQRLWRTVVRTKYQITRNRVQLQNRLEALLEEAHIKLSSLVSDLLGASARRRVIEKVKIHFGPLLVRRKKVFRIFDLGCAATFACCNPPYCAMGNCALATTCHRPFCF